MHCNRTLLVILGISSRSRFKIHVCFLWFRYYSRMCTKMFNNWLVMVNICTVSRQMRVSCVTPSSVITLINFNSQYNDFTISRFSAGSTVFCETVCKYRDDCTWNTRLFSITLFVMPYNKKPFTAVVKTKDSNRLWLCASNCIFTFYHCMTTKRIIRHNWD